MALEHCFSIIKNKEKIEKVNIPDDFINYIKDSLFGLFHRGMGKHLRVDYHIMERGLNI